MQSYSTFSLNVSVSASMEYCVCVCGPLLLGGHDDFNIAGGQRAFLDRAA